jgi:hypothetical protein
MKIIETYIYDILSIYCARFDNDTFLEGMVPLDPDFAFMDVSTIYNIVMPTLRYFFPDIEDRWALSVSQPNSKESKICLIRDDDPDELAALMQE